MKSYKHYIIIYHCFDCSALHHECSFEDECGKGTKKVTHLSSYAMNSLYPLWSSCRIRFSVPVSLSLSESKSSFWKDWKLELVYSGQS